MNYAQLRAFHWVSVEGGFSAAARRLRLTQPAISLQIRALEAEHGLTLFHRVGKRVRLTDAGVGLFELTQRLFDLEREAETYLGSVKGLRRGSLRVAADGPYDVIEVLAELRRRYPGIELSVTIGNSRQVRESLLQYEADAGVMAVDPHDPRIFCAPFRRHRIVVFVPRGHAWAGRASVPLRELDGQPMVRREAGSATRASFEQAAAAGGVSPRYVLEIGSREAVREAVCAGIGIGVVSEAEVGHDDRIARLPIADADVFTQEYLLCLAERQHSRAIRAFLEIGEALAGG